MQRGQFRWASDIFQLIGAVVRSVEALCCRPKLFGVLMSILADNTHVTHEMVLQHLVHTSSSLFRPLFFALLCIEQHALSIDSCLTILGLPTPACGQTEVFLRAELDRHRLSLTSGIGDNDDEQDGDDMREREESELAFEFADV
jgi:hypothetical protein